MKRKKKALKQLRHNCENLTSRIKEKSYVHLFWRKVNIVEVVL